MKFYYCTDFYRVDAGDIEGVHNINMSCLIILIIQTQMESEEACNDYSILQEFIKILKKEGGNDTASSHKINKLKKRK